MKKITRNMVEKALKQITPQHYAEASAKVIHQLRAAGFNPEEIENENILTVTSMTDKEIIGVCHMCIDKYNATKDIKNAASIWSLQETLERRGLKDAKITEFLKNNTVENIIMEFLTRC
jgi:hypothetical protein